MEFLLSLAVSVLFELLLSEALAVAVLC